MFLIQIYSSPLMISHRVRFKPLSPDIKQYTIIQVSSHLFLPISQIPLASYKEYLHRFENRNYRMAFQSWSIFSVSLIPSANSSLILVENKTKSWNSKVNTLKKKKKAVWESCFRPWKYGWHLEHCLLFGWATHNRLALWEKKK